jgi:hypothetical protein
MHNTRRHLRHDHFFRKWWSRSQFERHVNFDSHTRFGSFGAQNMTDHIFGKEPCQGRHDASGLRVATCAPPEKPRPRTEVARRGANTARLHRSLTNQPTKLPSFLVPMSFRLVHSRPDLPPIKLSSNCLAQRYHAVPNSLVKYCPAYTSCLNSLE